MAAVSLSYPEDVPQYCCRLLFKKYSRPRPGATSTAVFDGVIRLPIPTSLNDQFGMDISDVKLDVLGNHYTDLMAAGVSRKDQFMKEYNGGGGLVEAIKNLAIDGAALVPGISDSRWGQIAQLETGMVRNPHHTAIFNGVQLKSYAFTWKMSARSQAEAIAIENIIKQIKTYMHPQLSPTGFSMEYPYLTELNFSVGDNNLVPNVKTSFIKGLTINGSAGGVPSFYRDGRSTIVEMSISFQEINVQTRDDFSVASNQASVSG
jgi:hypothetical protein